MSQDKEYIPEWKQPHIGSEARKFITFEYNGLLTIDANIIAVIELMESSVKRGGAYLIIKSMTGYVLARLAGTDAKLKELHQSILDQLNQ